MNSATRELTDFEYFLNQAGFVRWETQPFLFIHPIPKSHDVVVAVCPFGPGQDTKNVQLFITDISETEKVLDEKREGMVVFRSRPIDLIGAILKLLSAR